jgi:hypothetical protein
MNIKKIAGTAALAAGLGAAGLGLGAGSAQADRIWVPDVPDIPWIGHWVDDVPNLVPGEGPTGLGAPGQLKKLCPAPFNGPPGHWVGGPNGFVPCV